MVVSLGKEQGDEVAKKDGCITDLNTNDKQTAEQTNLKEDKDTEVADLDSTIASLTEEEKQIKQQIADIQVEMKRASENRETENKDFQETVADQRATQAILKKA